VLVSYPSTLCISASRYTQRERASGVRERGGGGGEERDLFPCSYEHMHVHVHICSMYIHTRIHNTYLHTYIHTSIGRMIVS